MRKVIAIGLIMAVAASCLWGCSSDNSKAPAASGAESGTEKEAAGSEAKETENAESMESTEASGKPFDSKTVTLYCPVATGTEMDTLSRLVSEYLPKYLDGQNVVVENIAGAGTTVCGSQVYAMPQNSPCMILLDTYQQIAGPVINKAVYDETAFTPLLSITSITNAVYAKAGGDIKTWEDVAAKAEKNGFVTLGTGGSGGGAYTFLNMLCRMADIPSETLVANNIPESIVNTMGGRSDICIGSYAVARDYVLSGEIIPVLTLDTEPFTGYAGHEGFDNMNIPTAVEKGIDFTVRTGHALCMKADTDADYQNYYYQALLQMYQDADFQNALTTAGYDLINDNSREVAEKMKDDMVSYLPTIKKILELE